MRFRRIAALLGATMLLAAACSSDGSNPIFGSPDDGGDSPTATGDDSGGFGFGDLPADAGASYQPLPVREGLGTFDNYEWHMELTTVGPTVAERTTVATRWSHNADPLSHYSSIETTQEGPDYDGVESSTTEIFRVENDTCQFDGEDWSYTGATDQQAEVLQIIQRLVDFTIVPENPVEVGQESIVGIAATHWRYAVSGFGSDSGALVTENQVDYWMSNDTGVLLKYAMVVESRSGPTSDPEAEVYRVETTMDLVSANTPIPIDLPTGCLTAKAEADAAG